MPEGSLNGDKVRGNVDKIVLRALLNEDNYVYEMMKTVFLGSYKEYRLKAPSLYTKFRGLKVRYIAGYLGVKPDKHAAADSFRHFAKKLIKNGKVNDHE